VLLIIEGEIVMVNKFVFLLCFVFSAFICQGYAQDSSQPSKEPRSASLAVRPILFTTGNEYDEYEYYQSPFYLSYWEHPGSAGLESLLENDDSSQVLDVLNNFIKALRNDDYDLYLKNISEELRESKTNKRTFEYFRGFARQLDDDPYVISHVSASGYHLITLKTRPGKFEVLGRSFSVSQILWLSFVEDSSGSVAYSMTALNAPISRLLTDISGGVSRQPKQFTRATPGREFPVAFCLKEDQQDTSKCVPMFYADGVTPIQLEVMPQELAENINKVNALDKTVSNDEKNALRQYMKAISALSKNDDNQILTCLSERYSKKFAEFDLANARLRKELTSKYRKKRRVIWAAKSDEIVVIASTLQLPSTLIRRPAAVFINYTIINLKDGSDKMKIMALNSGGSLANILTDTKLGHHLYDLSQGVTGDK
jgi:hypothetical protein